MYSKVAGKAQKIDAQWSANVLRYVILRYSLSQHLDKTQHKVAKNATIFSARHSNINVSTHS